jgi:hypothetical protein
MLSARSSFKLDFSPYRNPRFRVGAVDDDEVRGEVKIVKVTDAPVPVTT